MNKGWRNNNIIIIYIQLCTCTCIHTWQCVVRHTPLSTYFIAKHIIPICHTLYIRHTECTSYKCYYTVQQGVYFTKFEIAATRRINFHKINKKPHPCTQRSDFTAAIFVETFISQNSQNIHPSKIITCYTVNTTLTLRLTKLMFSSTIFCDFYDRREKRRINYMYS